MDRLNMVEQRHTPLLLGVGKYKEALAFYIFHKGHEQPPCLLMPGSSKFTYIWNEDSG